MRGETVLLVTDKWETYVIDNDHGDEWAALDLVKQRLNDDFWYFDEAKEQAEKIVEQEDAPAAFKFLMDRRDAEYEWVEVTKPRKA